MASAFVRLILPRVPLMVKQVILHILSLSPTASKWDLKTELIITVLRSILSGSTSSISRQQNFSLKDPGVKGPMWISRVTFPQPPEDDVRQMLFQAIEDTKVTGNETYTKPDLIPVEAEWTGYRPGVSKNEPEPSNISEQEKFRSLMKEVSSDATILYFHGGAYYMMDPATHRIPTCTLAKFTKGRVLNVRYRLAPQHPFPAAVLDCLIAYLNLLYPPKDSLHTAVKPEHVVFAGDSAGGNMCLVLTQLILHLQRSDSSTVTFNGARVSVPLPGGLAMNSAWTDVTRSSPSLFSNAKYDYLPLPNKSTAPREKDPLNIHPCQLWPADPARADLYCDGSALCHPLVSPLGAARPESWKGAPPMLFIAGEEMLGDEIAIVASRCARQGVKVRWEGYESMPHVFSALLEGTAVSKRCYRGWAEWIDAVVDGEKVPTGGVWIAAKTLKEKHVSVESLTPYKDEDVTRRMDDERVRRIKVFEAYQRTLQHGSTEKARL